MFKYILSLFFVIISAPTYYCYEDCGSQLGELSKLTISGCPNMDQRCILPRGTNASIDMTFSLKQDVETVTADVCGVILGQCIHFALPNPNGCVNSGLECPLKAGGNYTYKATLPVEKIYPKVTVDVKWILENEKKEKILCLLIPAKIQ